MNQALRTIVCFAVKEESRPFEGLIEGQAQVRTLLTGIGPRNAERAIRAALAETRPELVLSCGFAGGLKPELETGTILFDADKGTALESRLRGAGALPGRFHCADKVATTVEEKRQLLKTTGADAVEMESQNIRKICHTKGIASATVRVILDTANEDLPLDFNRLMTAEQQLDGSKLALRLIKSPGKIPLLLAFRKQTKSAAERLASVLAKALGDSLL